MKSILLKRLESSFFAFKMTLERFIFSHQRFLDMCEKGDVYISKKVDVYDLLDNGDDTKLMELVDLELIRHFKIEEFESKFMPSIQKDLKALQHLKDSWAKITVDPKIEQFKFELKTNKILKGSKIIVFTESKETASYLGREIGAIYGDRVVFFSGESSNYLKKEIEDSFNPKNKKEGKDKFDILITTDVLAEGVNLHRSDIVINYDLPWNPTKIMQRVGRINRVGTEFDRIYVFNFFPTSQADRHLSLKDRIIQKLQAFHDTLGEDFKYLSEDEQVTSHKLYNNLSENLDDDEEGTNPELAYLALLRQIRDNETELFDKIKKIPIKAKVGKKSKILKNTGTLSFMRKGYLKMFVMSEGETSMVINFMDAIAMIKADKEEKSISISEDYYEQLLHNKKLFDNRLIEEIEGLSGGGGIKGNDAKMIDLLKTLSRCKKFTNEQDEIIVAMIELWENGEVPISLTKEILRDLKVLKVADELQAFYEIHDRIPERYFAGRNKKHATTSGEKQIVLSAYMKNGG
jgi:superfamily II DNA helicase RecQ